jgi:hypothetical protein
MPLSNGPIPYTAYLISRTPDNVHLVLGQWWAGFLASLALVFLICKPLSPELFAYVI